MTVSNYFSINFVFMFYRRPQVGLDTNTRIFFEIFRVFSHDVTAAILVSQNNETAAMLVSQTSPVGVEFLSYANAFFCSNKFA